MRRPVQSEPGPAWSAVDRLRSDDVDALNPFVHVDLCHLSRERTQGRMREI